MSTNQKKIVAIVSPEFRPHTNWGGIATFNEELAYLLEKIGFEIHIFTYNPNGDSEIRLISKNITHHLIPLKTSSKIFNFSYHKFIRPILKIVFKALPNLFFFLEWNFFSLFYFKKIAKNMHIFSIHTPSFSSPALFIKTFFRSIPLIVHIQSLDKEAMFFSKKSVDSHIKGNIEKLYIKYFSNIVVACNKSLKNKISSFYKKKIYFIPNFVHIKKSKKVVSYTSRNKLDNLIFWGRIEHRKGVEQLIKAFIKLKKDNAKLKLWLIGDSYQTLLFKGKYLNLAQFINAQDINSEIKDDIHHIPRINSRSTLRKLAQDIGGISVFPSLHEPFGFVYIESMSMGLLTIASNSGEGANIIDHDIDGFVCAPSANKIVDTILHIQKLNKDTLDLISQNALKKVQTKYSISAVIHKYKKIYDLDLGL